MLPTFVVIGAPKTGTTSLYEYLRTHPQIFLPDLKETNFFLEEGNWTRGLDWYRSLYTEGDRVGASQAGDVSPGYSTFPVWTGVAARMAATLPDAKLVYLVRDPVERMRSQYVQNRADGFERRPLRQALLENLQYLAFSLYALQLDQYLEHYERSQILVLRSEDLAAHPQDTLNRVLGFLSLEAGWTPPNLGQDYNPTEAKRVTRKGVGRIENLLHRAGREREAWWFRDASRRSSLLSRQLAADETVIDEELIERLRCFVRADAARLRDFAGAEFDAWGLA